MLKNRVVSVILILILCLSTMNFQIFALESENNQQDNLDTTKEVTMQPSETSSQIENDSLSDISFADIMAVGEYMSEEQLSQFGTGALSTSIPQQQNRSSSTTNPHMKISINTLAKERIEAEYGDDSCLGRKVYALGYEFNNSSNSNLSNDPSSFPDSLLPSAVDNSTLPSFPEIGNQETSNSCVAWSLGYYQLTHNTGLVRGLNANTPDNVMSPRFMYNLINNGTNSYTQPIDAMNAACSFGCATVSQTGIVDSSNPGVDEPTDDSVLGTANNGVVGTPLNSISTWDFGPDIWESALSNKAKNAYVFYAEYNTEYTTLKKLLANGYVASFLTDTTDLIYSYTTSPVGEDICIGASEKNSPIPGDHAMTIVGYDDTVWKDLNGNRIQEPDELGAFKIANSWGYTEHYRSGFCWVLYSALYAHITEDGVSMKSVFDGSLVYFLEPTVSYTPLAVAEVTLNTAKRNEIRVSFDITDSANGSTSASAALDITDFKDNNFHIPSNLNDSSNNYDYYTSAASNLAFRVLAKNQGGNQSEEIFANFLNLSPTAVATDATFRFDLTPVIQKYYDETSFKFDSQTSSFEHGSPLYFHIYIHDSLGNSHPTKLKSYKIKDNRYDPNDEDGGEAITYWIPVDGCFSFLTNGSPTPHTNCAAACTSYTIKPRLVSADKQFSTTFNYPIIETSLDSGVQVKPKETHNTYGAAVNVEKESDGIDECNVLTITPPAVDAQNGNRYAENQYYSIIFSTDLKTVGGNFLPTQTCVDFYILPEPQENNSQGNTSS